MLKFAAGSQEGPSIVGFGLSKENVDRLQRGDPIVVKLEEMGLALPRCHVIIFYGDTEAILHDQMQEFIGPDTKVVIDPRVKL